MACRGGCTCNVAFLGSPSGVLKILELIWASCCLICSSVWRARSYAGYMLFASVITLVYEIIIIMALYCSATNEDINAPWTLIDLIFTACIMCINIIAFGVACAYGHIAAYGGAAFFFLVLLICQAVEIIFQCIEICKSRSGPTVHSLNASRQGHQ